MTLLKSSVKSVSFINGLHTYKELPIISVITNVYLFGKSTYEYNNSISPTDSFNIIYLFPFIKIPSYCFIEYLASTDVFEVPLIILP